MQKSTASKLNQHTIRLCAIKFIPLEQTYLLPFSWVNLYKPGIPQRIYIDSKETLMQFS